MTCQPGWIRCASSRKSCARPQGAAQSGLVASTDNWSNTSSTTPSSTAALSGTCRTVDELRRLLPETRELAIERYELPNLGAVNFLVRGLLGTGATSTLRLDAQAKALGEWLRARSTKLPRSLVKP